MSWNIKITQARICLLWANVQNLVYDFYWSNNKKEVKLATLVEGDQKAPF